MFYSFEIFRIFHSFRVAKQLKVKKIVKNNEFEYLKKCTTGKVQFLFFKWFLLALTKFWFREEDWLLGNYFIKIWDFSDSSYFPKILSLKSFGNSWATRTYQFITNNHASFPLTWKENLLKHQQVSKFFYHDCLQVFLLLFIS